MGEAWLFTISSDGSRPPSKLLAGRDLKEAEKLAGLKHIDRGGWHLFGRAWGTARKHRPVQDVMAAGGWRDEKALEAAYQQADPETTRKVMELGESA